MHLVVPLILQKSTSLETIFEHDVTELDVETRLYLRKCVHLVVPLILQIGYNLPVIVCVLLANVYFQLDEAGRSMKPQVDGQQMNDSTKCY